MREDGSATSAEDAFVRWASLHIGRLHRVAYLLCGDWHVAEDVVQDALSSCAVQWKRIERMDSPEAYVRRALVNATRQRHRRRWTAERPVWTLPDSPIPDGSDHRAMRDELLTALRQLPHRQRATVVLRYLEQLSEAETADALGCSVGTVKSQTSRALSSLRRALAAEEVPCSPISN